MKTTKTKKPNTFWLKSKQVLCRALVTMGLLLGLSYGAVAQNTAYGTDALNSITTGVGNAAFGYQSLYSNTTGDYNTANGMNALYSNTTGHRNTANGNYALVSNTTGNYNTANGTSALYYNTTGNYNTANGYSALGRNTTGYSNTANGYTALFYNTTGYQNTANGTYALYSNTTGYYNTANGTQALYSNTTGFDNTANGTQALSSNTTGFDNTANGYRALFYNTTGYNNTANGTQALLNNTTGYNNTANGTQALYSNTTGGFNTASGYQALYANTTGDGNTAIGDRSLLANTIGNYNTAVGSLALNTSTKGKYNTAVGYNADIADRDIMTGNDITNATAIGSTAWVDQSNKVVIGDRSVTVIGGYANWSNLSDARFKKNIQQDVHGLDFITKLNPITYTLDIKKLNSFLGVDERNAKRQQQPSPQQVQAIATKEAIRYTGFLAQEVEQAAQAVNYNFSGVIKPASDKGHYSMSYSDFVVPLVKAVQEQQTQIEKQQKVNEQLQQQVEDQQKVNQQLQQRLETLEKLLAGNTNITKDVVTKEVETTGSEDITLYPNPTTGIFTITASNINNGVIEIYDMAGNNLQKTAFNNGKTGHQLNVSGYAKGVYLLNIIANNKKYTKRLVIQ